MKRKEIKGLHEKTREELLKMLSEIKTEVGRLKVEKVSGKLKNTNQIFLKKKDIARVLTVLEEKEFTELARGD